MASMATSTKGQYDTHLRKFKEFCLTKGHQNYLRFPYTLGVEFLTSMFKSGLSYSSINLSCMINSARSALSQFTIVEDSTWQFGKHPIVTRFMRGIFRLRTPKPKYKNIWDVKPVLIYLESLDESSIKLLSYKCVMLLALTTGQRVQTLAALDLRFMTKSENKIVFSIEKILKTSKPGTTHMVEVHRYTGNRTAICPFLCLCKYIEKTSAIRTTGALFLSYLKPHRQVVSQSISRWLCETLKKAGIPTNFGSHSVRHASASKAADMNVSVDQILQTVGWSSEKTFASFYRREIAPEDNNYAKAVLGDKL